MRHVSVAELKADAEELIAAVEAGEEVVITHRRSRFRLIPTAAEIVADDEDTVARRRAAMEETARFRADLRARGVRITQAEIKEWINEGRH